MYIRRNLLVIVHRNNTRIRTGVCKVSCENTPKTLVFSRKSVVFLLLASHDSLSRYTWVFQVFFHYPIRPFDRRFLVFFPHTTCKPWPPYPSIARPFHSSRSYKLGSKLSIVFVASWKFFLLAVQPLYSETYSWTTVDFLPAFRSQTIGVLFGPL